MHETNQPAVLTLIHANMCVYRHPNSVHCRLQCLRPTTQTPVQGAIQKAKYIRHNFSEIRGRTIPTFHPSSSPLIPPSPISPSHLSTPPHQFHKSHTAKMQILNPDHSIFRAFVTLAVIVETCAALKLNVTALSADKRRVSTIECWQMDTPFTVSTDAGIAGSASVSLGNVTNLVYTVLPAGFDGGLHVAPKNQ